MPVTQVDKALVRRRFCRSRTSYADQASVQREMAERLCALLAGVEGDGADLGRVLELGCGTGVFTRALLARFSMQGWMGNDIVCDCKTLVDEVRDAGVPDSGFIHADMESCDFPAGWNVVGANASFQWLDDSVGFAGRICRRITPGGLLVFSLFGPDNLREVRSLTGHGLHYVGREQVVAGLAPHCDVLVADEYHRRVAFASPRDVLRHLKATGTNAIVRSHWLRRDLESFASRYREESHAADGQVELTYHPMLFVARVNEGSRI